MNADGQPDLHAERADAYPFKEETHEIIGCAFDVLNELGHGLNEKCYENSLTVEFRRRQIAYDQQRRFEVLYKGEHVGEFIPDLIAYARIIVDAKVIERITDHKRGQMLNFLRVTRLPLGLILNSKHPRLEWGRVVLSGSICVHLRPSAVKTSEQHGI
jgi:GxxExxY protein